MASQLPAIDKGLMDLFTRFNLESKSVLIADALGVEVPADFKDVMREQIFGVSKIIGLKPVHETRLLRLHQFVLEGQVSDMHIVDEALTPRLASTQLPAISAQAGQGKMEVMTLFLYSTT